MLKKLTIVEDPLAPDTWETVDVENVCEYLTGCFDVFPEHARIYQGQISEDNDVTPKTEAEIEALQQMAGPFFVVVYPADPVSIIVAVAFSIIAAVALRPDIPEPPEPMTRKQDNSSPNNELSERKNRPRVNGRIPDIFGKVRSTPDLIAPNYEVYENSLKVEHSLMCIGKGSYDVPEEGVREGSTPAVQITDNSLEVFPPNINPNPAGTPQLTIGNRITESFLSTDRNSAVNGQTLNPFTDPTIEGDSNIGFRADFRSDGNHIYYIQNDGTFDFRSFISEGSNIEVSDASFTLRYMDRQTTAAGTYTWVADGQQLLATFSPKIGLTSDGGQKRMVTFENADVSIGGEIYNLDGVYLVEGYNSPTSISNTFVKTDPNPPEVNPGWAGVIANPSTIIYLESGYRVYQNTIDEVVDLGGTYQVAGVEENQIVLVAPNEINSDWEKVVYQQRGTFALPLYQSPTLENLSGNVIGPFFVDDPDTTQLILNFGALQGAYKDTGTEQSSVDVSFEIDITPVDISGAPTGTTSTHASTLYGSSVSKSPRYVTKKINMVIPSRYSVLCRRITPFVSGFSGQVLEETKWLDLYGAKNIDSLDFGDVTLVRSKARATAGATSAESRELNLEVTRKIPLRVSGSEFTTELFPTQRADEIFSFIAMDPRIGNRSVDELDFENIYSTVQEIEEYFGSDIATQFNYTFDSDNLSFEEMAKAVADAIFCTAYRRGSQLKLSFEKETENSTILFNHRNKLPGSETRTVRFGNRNDNDGVEFDYVDPADNAVKTFYLPDQNIISPQKVDMPGIRSRLQAYFHANRLWNKIQYQHIATEFEATQEADLLILKDRILNADNTRPNIQDGEIVNYYGFELELSQPVVFSDGSEYVIFLQSPEGVVESIPVSAGSSDRKVILAQAPAFSLSIDPDNYAKTTYLIVEESATDNSAFILTEKQPTDKFTSTITAINYDSRYYDNDKDLENGIVGTDGNTI